MIPYSRLVFRAAAVLAVLAALAPRAGAGFVVTVTADVSQTPSGPYRYAYTLANDAASTLSAFDFLLDVSPLADLQSITTPPGWFPAYVAGDTSLYVLSLTPATDLAPGTSATFSFLSPLAPGAQAYAISGLNPTTFDFDTQYGTVLSPTVSPVTTVPAPPSAVLALAGVATAAGAAGVRRRAGRCHLA
jgi:hypothetical protein